jgi:hypothetical protein
VVQKVVGEVVRAFYQCAKRFVTYIKTGFRSNNTSLLDEGFIPQYAGTLQNPRGSTPFVLRYIGGIVGIMHVAIVPLPKTFFIFIEDNFICSQKVT